MASKAAHQYINMSSGKTEYYTPRPIVNAARCVMGHFDLDVASSQVANDEIVQATLFYEKPESRVVDHWWSQKLKKHLPVIEFDGWGGLDRPWRGKIWMNHPFAVPEQPCKSGCTLKRCEDRGWHTASKLPGTEHWIDRLVHEYRYGSVDEAMCITFASPGEGWAQSLAPFAKCFLSGRTHYLDPDTLEPIKNATKGSMVTYFGDRPDAFDFVFAAYGEVKFSFASLDQFFKNKYEGKCAPRL